MIKDYCLRINQTLKSEDLVSGPKNIFAAARVSNNRVIIFLAQKELMEDFITQHGSIFINSKFIHAKKLSNKKKFIFSNILPVIPNNIVEKHLTEELKLILSSKIFILRVNSPDEMFSHIISWRRQFYCKIKDEKITDLPNSFFFHFGDKIHRIYVFLAYDKFVCFKCNNRGKVNVCPTN